MKLYLDTSVFGGCFDKEFEIWSNQLFSEINSGNHTAIISKTTIGELKDALPKVSNLIKIIPTEFKEFVTETEETVSLAEHYVKEGVLTEKNKIDAIHIAIATINRVDVIVSWNFKHMVNLIRIRNYNAVNLKLGYAVIDIRSPKEVVSL